MSAVDSTSQKLHDRSGRRSTTSSSVSSVPESASTIRAKLGGPYAATPGPSIQQKLFACFLMLCACMYVGFLVRASEHSRILVEGVPEEFAASKYHALRTSMRSGGKGGFHAPIVREAESTRATSKHVSIHAEETASIANKLARRKSGNNPVEEEVGDEEKRTSTQEEEETSIGLGEEELGPDDSDAPDREATSGVDSPAYGFEELEAVVAGTWVRDETLAPPSDCEKSFVGWELLMRWREAQTEWCHPLRAQGAARASDAQSSSLQCGALDIPLHGTRYICDGRNLSVAFSKAVGAGGGENVEDVFGRSDKEEFYKYQPGFLRARCEIPASLNKQPEGLQPSGKDWIPALQTVQPTDAQGLECEEWIEEPTVVVTRVEYANWYHAMTDLVGSWTALIVAGVDPRTARVLFSDGHPKSPYDGAWARIFGGHKPLRKADLQEKRVCLRHAVFALYGYASPMTINWFREDKCAHSAWLKAFAHQVLAAYDMAAPSRVPASPKEAKSYNITLILREDYVAHPRDFNGGKRHNKIKNPDGLMATMPKGEQYNAQRVQMAFIPFEEQLQLMRNTNILIGMHGAAMTYIPFLNDNAVVLELVPKNGLVKFHFQNLAAWAGKGFLLWRNPFGSNEIDEYTTFVDEDQFKGLVGQAIGILTSKWRDASNQ